MMVHYSAEDMLQNLKDAGCDEFTIKACMDDFQAERQESATLLMQKHRRQLLDTLHKYQKQIDCLDYLIFMLQKMKKQKIINLGE